MKLKRLGVVFLVFLLLMTGGMVSFAEGMIESNGIIVPYYTYVSSVGAGLDIESDGYAYCEGVINLYNDYYVDLTVTLQRSTTGKTWTNVKSWTESYYGRGIHYMEKGYYVTSGYTYRVMTTGKVKSGSTTLETVTAYSPTDSY